MSTLGFSHDKVAALAYSVPAKEVIKDTIPVFSPAVPEFGVHNTHIMTGSYAFNLVGYIDQICSTGKDYNC